MSAQIFARRLFQLAGWYGLIVLVPQWFLERQIGVDHPPAITHPEFFYGFVGVAVAWQIAFLIIATDPMRYRPLMLAAVVEKFSFGIAVPILYLQHRVPAVTVGFAAFDLVLGLLFVAAWIATSSRNPTATP